MTGGLPLQRASNADNIPILWRNDVDSPTYLYQEPIGFIIKNPCLWFFATDIQEVSQHITTYQVVRPCGFYDQLTDWRSVSNNPLKWVLFSSHTYKSHTKLLCMHVWKLAFPKGFQYWWMWFGNTMTRLEFVPFKSLAKCTITMWTQGGNQWNSFLVQLSW